MRFTRLETVAFGPLEGRAFPVDSDVVLVYGPNEAGKSSFRAAIETVLYGFKPADRDLHPLAQWDPNNPQTLQLVCELQLDTGDRLGVERVLQKTGKSRFSQDGEDFSGKSQRNRALACVDWLARDVFRELYSLELEQLAELDPSARADIDDLLMPHTSALPLRSAAEIRDELRSEYENLWRPDRRGKPAARRLGEQLKEARDRLGEARDRDRALRAARSERAEIESALEALLARKRECERENADASFLGMMFDWKRRARALGPAIDLSEFGDRRLVRPGELDAEIESLGEQLREPRARLARDERSLSERAATMLESSIEIDRAVEELSSWNADRERLAEQKQDAEKARERACEELCAAFGGPSTESQLEAAAAVPIEALASAAAEWSDARDRAFNDAESTRNHARTWETIAGGSGLALIALGVYGELDVRLILAGAVLLSAALLAGAVARPRNRHKPIPAPAEFDTLLGELSVPRALTSSPAALQRLVGLLAATQRLLADAQERERLAEGLATAIRDCENRWKSLCERVGIESNSDGSVLVARLRAALESARAEWSEIERDRRERNEAQRLIEFEKPALDAKNEHREKLQAVLRAAEPDCDDLEEAFQRVEKRRSDAAFLRQRETELREDPRFAAFECDSRIGADQPPKDAPWIPEIAAAREHELSELEKRLSTEQHRLGELSEFLNRDDAGAVSDASDAVRDIREQIESAERERDRLALLESILAQAESDFREEHQPDVLRRASDYFERVTNGRYRRIDLLDGDEGLLGVTPDGRSEPIEVGDPLSQGTLDQIFLCLRLGMLDHLDDGQERLPLILDDALLRMDDQRRPAVYALLGSMAPTRQVWILTCHRALADEVENNMKVTRIDL